MADPKKHSSFNFIANELEHNKDVKQRLDLIENDLKDADSAEALLASLKSSDPASIIYQNKIGKLWALLGLLLAGAAIYMFFASQHIFGAVLVALALAAGTGYYWYTQKHREREQFLQDAFSRYEELKYGFTYNQSQPGIDFYENIGLFKGAFSRGDYNNDIRRFASGSIKKDDKTVDYTVMHYYFVNRSVTYRGSGKKRKRLITDYAYNAYGLAISDVKFPAFALATYKMDYYPVPWTTSDGNFNSKYSISGTNEIELAKLMQPRNVLWFEKIFEEMPRDKQVIRKTGAESHRTVEHSVLDKSEIIVASEYPSLYWTVNLDLFGRTWDKRRKLKTNHELADSLASVELKGFETLMKSIHPLLEKAV